VSVAINLSYDCDGHHLCFRGLHEIFLPLGHRILVVLSSACRVMKSPKSSNYLGTWVLGTGHRITSVLRYQKHPFPRNEPLQSPDYPAHQACALSLPGSQHVVGCLSACTDLASLRRGGRLVSWFGGSPRVAQLRVIFIRLVGS